MSKKDFAGALRKSATTQKRVIDDRFAKADSVLLGMKPEAVVPPSSSQAPGLPDAAQPALPLLAIPAVDAPPDVPKAESMVVRDTFSMPSGDHELIEQLRIRAAREGRNTNKSEVVRAGLRALVSLAPSQLLELLEGLERVKPGRK